MTSVSVGHLSEMVDEELHHVLDRRELPLYKIRGRVLFKVGEILAYREEARIEARGAV